MSKITIEVKLSDDDRALLQAVTTAAETISGKAAAPKATKAAAPAKAAPKRAKAEDDDEADAGEDDADAGEDDADAGEDDDFGAEDSSDDDSGPTRDDVQAALREYALASSKADAMKLLKMKSGAESLSKLPESKFEAVIKAAKAATKKAND